MTCFPVTIGGGTVGNAIAKSYTEYVGNVLVYDVKPELGNASLDDVFNKSTMIFVCLPTPLNGGNKCNLSYIESLFEMIKGEDYNLVLKSTVPIGTTEKLRSNYRLSNLIHSPEFLTARCAVTDAQLPSRNVIGSPINCTCTNYLVNLYSYRFPNTPILSVYSNESELIKLITNAFFATKISFFNEMYQLCKNTSCNWDDVIAGVLMDGRIVTGKHSI